jgi:hypothetical protein
MSQQEQQQQQSMEIESAILEAIELPEFVYVLALKKKVPLSMIDNQLVEKVPNTNRRRFTGTYAEEADGVTKVHKVSVYIKSAKPEGEEAGEKKPRSRKPKADGVDSPIKKSSKRSKRLSEKETEVIGEILVALGKLQKLHKSSRKAVAAAESASA